MNKFIEFNDGIFNTRHIIAMTKCKRDGGPQGPQYGIALHVTGDIERQYFDNEYKRDKVFNQVLRELLNE